MAIRGERQPVPAKMTEREAAAAVNSPVKTYTMSPEELEDYRAKTGYKAPTDQHGQQEKKPIELPVGQRIAAKAPEAAPAPTAAPIDISKILKERDDALVDLGNAREQIEKLKTQNTYAVALAGEAADKQQAEISQLKADKAELVRYLTTAKHELEELLKERDMLLQTVEKAVDDRAVSSTGNDPVNHPAHYTAGSVECIDAIEAATTGLSGGQAYATGAAIKYLWRWSRKGGAEDLRKARWYVDRLLGIVEQEGNVIGEAESAG